MPDLKTEGKVVGIFISPNRGDNIQSMDHAHVVPGFGIEGDRYYASHQNPRLDFKTGREITFIEIESIDFIRSNDGINISPDQTRRNILTAGISLNELVGKDFFIGSIQFRGVRLCEPCKYLAERTDLRILKSMEHKGGLRAQIITEGTIYINDTITTAG